MAAETEAPPTGTAEENGGAPLPGEDPDEQSPEATETEIWVEGSAGQISLAIGGKRPTESKLLISGGAFGVEGQFEKGERVKVEIEGRIGEIHVIDKIDSKTGDVKGCTRKHVLKLDGAKTL